MMAFGRADWHLTLCSGHLAPFVGLQVQGRSPPSTVFRSQAMHPPAPSPGPSHKAAMGAVEGDGGDDARAEDQQPEAIFPTLTCGI
jgi:hypothetical protein